MIRRIFVGIVFALSGLSAHAQVLPAPVSVIKNFSLPNLATANQQGGPSPNAFAAPLPRLKPKKIVKMAEAQTAIAAQDTRSEPAIRYEDVQEQVAAEGFLETERVLRERLALSTARNSDYAAIMLARLYFDHELYAEALAVFPSDKIENTSDAEKFVWAIANYQLGRFQTVQETFCADSGSSTLELKALCGLSSFHIGAYKESRASLADVDMAALSDPALRQDLLLARAEAAALANDHQAARSELLKLRTLGLSPSNEDRRQYIDALIRVVVGDERTGLSALKKIASGSSAYARKAELKLIDEQYRSQSINSAEARNRLEDRLLRWRGGAVEQQVRLFRAELSASDGDIEDALRLWRALAYDYPQADISREASSKIRTALVEIASSVQLSPFERARLFYENVDFAPPGADGDAIIRKVADELAVLGLAKEATELLEHQTFERLRGAARATVAADLASLYLALNDFENALRVLRTTRYASLPEAVASRRRILEARALHLRGATANALEILGEEKTLDAEELRAVLSKELLMWREAGDAYAAAALLAYGARAELNWLNAAASYILGNDDGELLNLIAKLGDVELDVRAHSLIKAISVEQLHDNPVGVIAAYRDYFLKEDNPGL